jgi:hypothetical protein
LNLKADTAGIPVILFTSHREPEAQTIGENLGGVE